MEVLASLNDMVGVVERIRRKRDGMRTGVVGADEGEGERLGGALDLGCCCGDSGGSWWREMVGGDGDGDEVVQESY